MGKLENKIALITGSSRGIGAAIARSFAQEGARVVLHGRDIEALESVKNTIEKVGFKAWIVTGNVTRFNEIEAMREKIEGDVGPLDILVANAGASLSMPGPLEGIDIDSWRATVEANLTATFLTLKSFVPGMKERQRGNIITISSAAARKADARSPMPYAAAKAGIQQMSQQLAEQVGPFGIRINCIAPESILTETNQKRIPDNIKQTMIEWHPIKRLGTPEDVAQAAVFLASDESSWISGIILDVAGGIILK